MHLIQSHLNCTLNDSRWAATQITLPHLFSFALFQFCYLYSRCNRTKTTTNILWTRKAMESGKWQCACATHTKGPAYFAPSHSLFLFPVFFAAILAYCAHFCLSAAHFTRCVCQRIDFQFLCLPKRKIHHGTSWQATSSERRLSFDNNKSVFSVYKLHAHL